MKNGFTAISVVLILGAVVVGVATTVTLLSIGEAQSALSLFNGEDNLSFVEGCTEDALQRIRANSTFSLTSFPLAAGTCTVSYTTGGPTNWDITVSSSGTSYTRKIRAVFVRNPTGMTLTSWREV